MGHTNSTANLSLPQFIGTDKPTWLGDVNGAFSAIDSYAGTNDAAVAAAASDASSAISQAAAAVNTANTANTTAGNASTAATAAVTAANQANALSNQVALRTGVLADLTTTDRTSIVNAINEVNGKDAGDIAYDNTGSGLTATNVQDAIDEVAQGGGGSVGAWTLAGTETGTTPIDISGLTYNELLIEFDIAGEGQHIIIPVAAPMLSGTATNFRGGHGLSSFPVCAEVDITTASVVMSTVYKANTDVTSTTTITVYYR